MFESLFCWLEWGLILYALLSLLTFIVPQLLHAFHLKEQDLKVKYSAKWAVVTGGSSGIGRAITEKLASQGINVVIVALEDALLRDLHKNLETQFPKLQFRAVGADLGGDDYMDKIIKATEDIDVSILFNNAGYVAIGLFADVPLERQLKNLHVNAISATKITHHFVRQMISKKLKGAVSFTSSPAGQMPCPFSLMYGASKAYLTEFGTSLAAEVKPDGIDVLVMHPSPVDTSFYNADTAHKSSSLAFFRKTAIAPTKIADIMFASLGTSAVVREQGYFSVFLRLGLKLVDSNFLTFIISRLSFLSSEYKNLVAERNRGKKE